VREQVQASIETLAQTTGAVILGRAAAVVLAAHPEAFHVRLDGPLERRAARAMGIEGVDEHIARSRLEETDRARAQYVERLYGRDPAEPGLYHLILDSTVLSVAATVEVVASAAAAYWEYGKLG
jgi:cytidylate kinase